MPLVSIKLVYEIRDRRKRQKEKKEEEEGDGLALS